MTITDSAFNVAAERLATLSEKDTNASRTQKLLNNAIILKDFPQEQSEVLAQYVSSLHDLAQNESTHTIGRNVLMTPQESTTVYIIGLMKRLEEDNHKGFLPILNASAAALTAAITTINLSGAAIVNPHIPDSAERFIEERHSATRSKGMVNRAEAGQQDLTPNL